MQLGDVIRRHRKDKNMTQDEMAKRLGVTAPAVNKWENGNSYPDITLLSPIARLLNVPLDELLSHEMELTPGEANVLIEQAHEKLKTEAYADAFLWMKQRIEEYPNCHYLMLYMARLFDSHRHMETVPEAGQYDEYILSCYNRALLSDDTIRRSAAEALFHFYMMKKQYDQAEKYLEYYSTENPQRKLNQARIYSETERADDAHKAYEELLYAGSQSLNMAFHGIYMLALHEDDYAKAHMIVEKIRDLEKLFEFGEYHEICIGIELAMIEKDEEATLRIAGRMLTNAQSIFGFTKSPLYSHIQFKQLDKAYIEQLREDLLKGFRDEEAYAYMKYNEQWHELLEQYAH